LQEESLARYSNSINRLGLRFPARLGTNDAALRPYHSPTAPEINLSLIQRKHRQQRQAEETPSLKEV